MGIQSASASFVRFYVPDAVSGDFWSYIDEKLRAGSFRECEDDQEQAMGFVSWDDLFDPSFGGNSYHKGEYIAFQFRVDQRTVPPIVRKQYIRRKVDEYRVKNNGKWPSRQERQEIQENVQNWLMNRIIPKPGGCEVVWNPAAKWMLLGGTGTKTIDAFLTHFEKHFRVYPIPLYHVHWALNMVPLDGRQKDMLASLVSAKSPNAMYEGRPLGSEFLTWLWFMTENAQEAIELTEGRRVEISLGERLVLTLPADGKERVICTTQANILHEARTGLRQGKLVDELQLFLRIGENEYFLTLDSFLWAVKGLRTPKQLPDFEDDDAEGKFLERMYFLEEVSTALNKLFEMFLGLRLSPAWERDSLPRIKTWMKERPQENG
ncbi:MAG TPA: recombination-associated protein RdgC [Syntrophobacteraceae bacterium]|nr:recombination-associated protein RdgC [Syntrophobacteraceae bacterium]